MSRFLLSIAVFLAAAGIAAPFALAETKPDDQVGVIQADRDGYPRYFKKWKDLKLDAKTRAGLLARNKQLDGEAGGFQKFRIGFLFIINGEVSRVAFYGDYGGVSMMDWPKGEVCSLSFEANGGYAGIHKQACEDAAN
ncbi:MAG: hypothetical protein ACAI44_24835 [Candidatus Sericytochromatia bacterium]